MRLRIFLRRSEAGLKKGRRQMTVNDWNTGAKEEDRTVVRGPSGTRLHGEEVWTKRDYS